MTTGWGAPRSAYGFARDTAAGLAEAALKEIPQRDLPDILICLGAQARAAARSARQQQPGYALPIADWSGICAPVCRLALEAAQGRRALRVPPALCPKCTADAMAIMADLLLDAMAASGIPRERLPETLDWLASRARLGPVPGDNS